MPTAFSFDPYERGGGVLMIDGSMLDLAQAVRVDDDYGQVRLAADPVVRLKLDNTESVQLWQLLDAMVGEHYREGEVVREEVERTKAEGLSTELPSHDAYLEAKDELLNPHLSEADRQEARNVITVYERAHGLDVTEGLGTHERRR